jgi:DNA-binding HxlR family transcriptional regulator
MQTIDRDAPADGPADGPRLDGFEVPPLVGADCQVRDVLDRVGDKWSVLVIFVLGSGTRRFTDLLRSIEGISQRMLTVTVRGLERDGLVVRTVYPVVPPRVEYALTSSGRTLLEAIQPLMEWAIAHRPDVATARAEFDARVPVSYDAGA